MGKPYLVVRLLRENDFFQQLGRSSELSPELLGEITQFSNSAYTEFKVFDTGEFVQL